MLVCIAVRLDAVYRGLTQEPLEYEHTIVVQGLFAGSAVVAIGKWVNLKIYNFFKFTQRTVMSIGY